MKNEELKNEGVIDLKPEEVNEVAKESKFKGFVSKAGAGIKKHGKKVAGVAALAAVGVIGYALGHKSGESETDYTYEDDFGGSDAPESSDVDVVSTEE